MSLSRSPSPHPGGGWSSPGLAPGSGSSTPRGYSPATLASGGISWAAAKAKNNEVRGYPSFSTRNTGFFSRQKHRISAQFPGFRAHTPLGYADKDVHRHPGRVGGRGPRSVLRRLMRRTRFRVLLWFLLVCIGYLLLWSRRKFVIIIGSNVEGGVMEWKGAREWAVERNSIWNKEKYAERWGYELEVANMLAKKRYSHEWRENWEKGDVLREAMRKYPQAEWFWWLDLNTWIMEYGKSLQHHIFNDLESTVYRDINIYNPLNITHPLPEFYLDDLGRSLEGDGRLDSLNMLLTQDCSGFNLGSFFVRRSLWTDRMLDAWWDPVMYEQKHMDWEHKEQDALEYIYQNQPWVRSSVGFLPQRSINAFPPGACDEADEQVVRYQESARDLVVNMAGCMFGRDCWAEMYNYRELSKRLNRTRWERAKDALRAVYERARGQTATQDSPSKPVP